MILQVLHWTIWVGIWWGILTVVLAVLYTILTDEQKEKIKKWLTQA